MFISLARLGHTLENFTSNIVDDWTEDTDTSRVAGYSEEEARRFREHFRVLPTSYGSLGRGRSPTVTRYRSALVIGSADAETMAETLRENGAEGFYFLNPQASVGISFTEHHPQFGEQGYHGANEAYRKIVFAVEVCLPDGRKVYCPFDRVRVTTQESYEVGRALSVPKSVLESMRFDDADDGVDVTAKENGEILANLSWHGTTFPADVIANLMNSSQVFANYDRPGEEPSLLEVFARHRGMRFVAAPFRSLASYPAAPGVHFGVVKGNGEFFIGGRPGEVLRRAEFVPERLLFSRPNGGSLGVFAPELVWR